MGEKLKNYLEHHDKVKFMEGVLNKDQEWQWFIDCIEKNFEINEVTTWQKYLNQRYHIEEILQYFIKMVETNPAGCTFSNLRIEQIYIVSEYVQGLKTKEEINEKLTFNFSKTLLLVVWITKIINRDNSTNYLTDMRIITQKNVFNSIDLEGVSVYAEEIEVLINKIELSDIEELRGVLFDNLNRIEQFPDIQYLETCRDKIINANAFGFTQLKDVPNNLTWEEYMLFSMLEGQIGDGLVPWAVNGDITVPNISEWTEERLTHLKSFFNHELANFIVETIALIKFNDEPSQIVIDLHSKLLIEQLQSKSSQYEKFGCSSFQVISHLLKNKLTKNINLKELMYIIQDVREVEDLKALKRAHFRLTQEQNSILKIHIEESAHQIDKIEKINGEEKAFYFSEYLKNEDITKIIDNEYFIKVSRTFAAVLEDGIRMVADLFIDYMKFLIRLNRNENVNKEQIKLEMINLQRLWEYKYYEISMSSMHHYSHCIDIDTKQVADINKEILNNIFSLSTTCIVYTDEEILQIMEDVSRDALIHILPNYYYQKRFPIMEDDAFNYKQGDIEALIDIRVNKLIRDYRYRFLNTVETQKYVTAIYNRSKQKVEFIIQCINKIDEFYEKLGDMLKDGYSLIDYNNELKLAHLTQLFPILEVQIKELGTRFGIFPFKEDEKHFMESKGPSSILRQILEESVKHTGGFEPVPDILFVYDFMYNGNSLNIRNECIHGRDYLFGNDLQFGFKVTMASLMMIIKRIELIDENLERDKV